MRALFRFITSTLAAICVVFMLIAAVIFWLFYHYGVGLPDYQALEKYEPPVVTRLHAGDGRLFAEYAVQKRIFVPIEAMPKRVVQTFLAAEDKNFYQHPGIDFFGLLRAIATNVGNIGSNKSMVGASTITQQVAKNFFLTRERSMARKAKEAILAFRIEHVLSKDRILELYLNEIYLGSGAYGVAAAALNYFNKSLDELTVAEAAFIAALPKAPNNYHPERHPEQAKTRRDWVISRMLEERIITADEAQIAKETPIKLVKADPARVVRADFFAEEVRRQIMNRYGESSLYHGGLSVRTSLDPKLQLIADQSLRAGVSAYDRKHGWRGPLVNLSEHLAKNQEITHEIVSDLLAQVVEPIGIGSFQMALVSKITPTSAQIILKNGKTGMILLKDLAWARRWQKGETLGPVVKSVNDVLHFGDVVLVEESPDFKKDHPSYLLRQIPEVGGALIVMDPHTGRVLAISGGYSYQMSEFNRATQALRQPGSSIKPFVYLAGMEQGYTPASVFEDSAVEINLGPGLGVWKPKNLTKQFYGPRTLRFALERSLNILTVRLTQAIGMKSIIDVTQRFGVYEKLAAQFAMVLGAGETTVLKLTSAYAMLANGGKKINPSLIDHIQDRHGKILYRQDNRACPDCKNQIWNDQAVPELEDVREQLADPVHVYQIVHMLEGAVERGSAQRAKAIGKPIAGKTGSTNEHRDAWFIGFSPDLVVGVYIGFDNPRSLGHMEMGARVALPVFVDFMQKALHDKPATPFRIPKGVKFVRINQDTGFPTKSSDPRAIMEAFKPGTEPKIAPSPMIQPMMGQPLPDGQQLQQITTPNDQPSNASPSPQEQQTPQQSTTNVDASGLY